MRRSGSTMLALVLAATMVGVVGSVGRASGVVFTPVGTVKEFSSGITAASVPVDIALSPGGDVWFAQETGNQVGRISPNGTVTEFGTGITAASGPFGIALGPDGDMWFTERTGARIGRITPKGKVTEFSTGISPGSVPTSIAEGPDGNMWFTEQTGNRIGRITPKGKVTEFSTGITAASNPFGIAAGPDGNMWFTEIGGPRIGRITPKGKVTEFSTGITAVSQPYQIAAGPDGNMWFTELQGDQVARIGTGVSSAVGTVIEFGTGLTANSQPAGIVLGSDRNMWFSEFHASQVGRITTGVPSAPRAVTASPRSEAAVVHWSAPTQRGAASISHYRVTATPGSHSCSTSGGARSCTVHGLKNGRRYRFTVTARNLIGTGPTSTRSLAVIAGTPTVPRALKVTAPHRGTASVTWRTPAFHGSTPISSYQVRWSHDGGKTWTAWTSTKLQRDASRTGLHNGNSYVVEVRARNHSGAGLVATHTFTQPR